MSLILSLIQFTSSFCLLQGVDNCIRCLLIGFQEFLSAGERFYHIIMNGGLRVPENAIVSEVKYVNVPDYHDGDIYYIKLIGPGNDNIIWTYEVRDDYVTSYGLALYLSKLYACPIKTFIYGDD